MSLSQIARTLTISQARRSPSPSSARRRWPSRWFVGLRSALCFIVRFASSRTSSGEYDGNTLLWNIVDGVLRVAVFVFYIWFIGRMSEIGRMFGYHGRAQDHPLLRARLAATPENARSFPAPARAAEPHSSSWRSIIAIFVYTVCLKRAHRRMGRARWCAEACACHLVAYRAHAGDRGRVL